MSFEWPVASSGRLGQSSFSPSREDANDGHLESVRGVT